LNTRLPSEIGPGKLELLYALGAYLLRGCSILQQFPDSVGLYLHFQGEQLLPFEGLSVCREFLFLFLELELQVPQFLSLYFVRL
jgi:hypothetical protein